MEIVEVKMNKRTLAFLFLASLIFFFFKYQLVDAENDTELISGIQDIYYEIGSGEIDFLFNVKVKEGYNVDIIQHGFDPSTPNPDGYTVSYYVSKNNSEGKLYPIKVYVYDRIENPIIKWRDHPSTDLTFYALDEITEKDLLHFVEAKGLHGRDLSHLLQVKGIDALQGHKVGSYEITFEVQETIRVHDQFRTLKSELKVPVQLVDHVAPNIELKEPIILDIFSQNVSYAPFFQIQDDYDDYHGYSLAIDYDDSRVDYHRIGTYELVVTATDHNGNTAQERFEVQMVDRIPPTIELFKEVIVYRIGEKRPDYRALVSVTDNYDTSIPESQIVILDNVQYDRKGAYLVTIMVFDQSLNSSTAVLVVRVVDEQAPRFDVVTGSDGKIHIPKYKDPREWYDFTSHIVYDDPTLRPGFYAGQVQFDKPGEYPVVLYVDDYNGNRTSQVISVVIIDDSTPPEIKGIPEHFIIPVHTKDFDFFEGITISDDYWDDPFLDKVENVDFNTIGTYKVTYLGYDESGNKAVIEVPVYVVDQEPPQVISKPSAIYLEVEEQTMDYRSLIEVQDNYFDQEALVIAIDDRNVRYGVVGTYEVIYRIHDPEGNETELRLPVYIIDRTPAQVNVSGPIVVEVGQRPRFWDYVTISDNYDPLDQLTIEFIDHHIDYEQLGEYVATVRVVDRSGNQTETPVLVRIVDTTAPILKGVRHRTIRKGQRINLLEGIQAIDNVDGDITHRIQIIGDYNIHKRGKYRITVTVTDYSGNETSQQFTLTVKRNLMPLLSIPLGVGLIFLLIGWYAYVMSKKEEEQFQAMVEDNWRFDP